MNPDWLYFFRYFVAQGTKRVGTERKPAGGLFTELLMSFTKGKYKPSDSAFLDFLTEQKPQVPGAWMEGGKNSKKKSEAILAF